MKTKTKNINILIFCLIFFITFTKGFTQTHFRSGMFLHHSTGGYIWGISPDSLVTTTVPLQMQIYNAAHNYTGNNAIAMEESFWEPPDENNWWLIRKFFDGDTSFNNNIANQFNFNYCLNHYKILVLKSCYPSSYMYDGVGASDTLDPEFHSIYNYKWHWRKILKVIKAHPQNFFVLWTNTPLLSSNTSFDEAALSKSFCKWAKDTLAIGLDSEFGPFPPNAYVFDYFRKITDNNGYMLPQYAKYDDDYHPNGYATNLLAPQFVTEIFDHAIAYEASLGLQTLESEIKFKVYPNPASTYFEIEYNANEINSPLSIKLSDIKTNIIEEQLLQNSNGKIKMNCSKIKKGSYYCTLFEGNKQLSVVKIIIE